MNRAVPRALPASGSTSGRVAVRRGREGGTAGAEEKAARLAEEELQQCTFDKFCIFTVVLFNCFAKLGCREGPTELVKLFG